MMLQPLLSSSVSEWDGRQRRGRGEERRRSQRVSRFLSQMPASEGVRIKGSVPAARLLGIAALLPQRSLLSYDWLATLTSAPHQSLPPPPGGPAAPPPPQDTHSTSSTFPRRYDGYRRGRVSVGVYRLSPQVAPANGAGPPPPPRTKGYHKRCVKSRGSGGGEGQDNII